MIDNSDKFGHFRVIIYARKNMVSCFQCPTIEDARSEAHRIAGERAARGLFAGKMTVAMCNGVKPLTYGASYEITN